jgi:hypothetical protein
MKRKALYGSLYVLGLLLCIVPPAWAVIDRFSLWQTGQRVSASVVLLLCVCCVPLWRQLRNAIKAFAENPSAWGVWLALTLIFWLFDRISADMLVICYIALPSSVLGALLMAAAHHGLRKKEE